MKASEAIARLQQLVAKHGDLDLVYFDLDTGWSLPMHPESIRAQRLEDGSIRYSISPLGGYSPRELRSDKCSLEQAVEDFVGEESEGPFDTGV